MKKTTTLFTLTTCAFSLFFLLVNPAKAQDLSGDIKLSRFFDPPVITPGSTVTVNVFLEKGYRGGLARLDEFIPKGFTATNGDDNGSRFYVTDTIIHFAWESMPEDPGFTVSYRLTVPQKLGKYTLVAQFIYVTSNGAVAAYFKPYTITVQLPPKVEEAPVAAKPVPITDTVIAKPVNPDVKNMDIVVNTGTSYENLNNTNKTKVETTPAPAETKVPVVEANNPPVQHPAIVAPKETAVPNPKPAPATSIDHPVNNGLWYRVQIMASSERLDADSVIINGIRDKLFIITKNGISRYYIGAYHELQPALDYRSRIINNGLKGPFVVAYKDGNKITIKESLSIVKTN